MLSWTSETTAQTYGGELELIDALKEVGLTPTPLPELPVKIDITVSDNNLVLHAREDLSGRVVITICDHDLW